MASPTTSWQRLGQPWNRLADEHALIRFLDTCLRGAGQVMLQNNPLTGLLFLVGIFWGALAAGSIQVGIGALAGLLVSVVTAMLLNVDKSPQRQGMYGFNGILVGIAVPTFLAPGPWMWVYLVIGAAASTVIMLAITTIFTTWGVPALTFPFVLTTWFLMLAAYSFTSLPITSLGIPALPSALRSSATSVTMTPAFLFTSFAAGISQVFLINNVVTGVIFVIALAVNSRRSALFAVIGSLLALATALALGARSTTIEAGLFGYSAVLTAIALGSVFYMPSWRVTLYSVFGIIVTVIVQAALNTTLAPIGIPPVTAPFVFATWLFLLPKGLFAPAM